MAKQRESYSRCAKREQTPEGLYMPIYKANASVGEFRTQLNSKARAFVPRQSMKNEEEDLNQAVNVVQSTYLNQALTNLGSICMALQLVDSIMKDKTGTKQRPESEATTGSPRSSDNFDERTSETSSDVGSPYIQSNFCESDQITFAEASRVKNIFPVKNTFIQFGAPPAPKLTKSSSAPDILCHTLFQRKRNPEMEEAHFRGVCKPCAYFTGKSDGCRWGTECPFCHLCTADDVKEKKKQKAKVMKAEAAAQRRATQGHRWWYRNHRTTKYS